VIVVWTPEAKRDSADIWDDSAAGDPGAAAKLATYPNLGKVGEAPGTRELLPHEKLWAGA